LHLNTNILSPLVHFFYLHNCLGWGIDVIGKENFLCLECINDLPHTGFALHVNNAVEKLFWGRIPITSAMSEFYFSKNAVIQNCIHEFKYRGNKKLGLSLGKMGKSLINSNRFNNTTALVLLPLFSKKEFNRRLNQSAILCEGIKEILNVPVINKSAIRIVHTETQTKKDRTERRENVEKSFSVIDQKFLASKHILVVDDVITPDAAFEACGNQISKNRWSKIKYSNAVNGNKINF
jgi:predicted amidophosphoribosyltransferase